MARILNSRVPVSFLHLYEYADFDLGGEADGDTISFPAAGTVIQQGKGITATQTVQGQEPISWEGGWYAFALDEIENGTPGVLSDAITPDSPGDQNFAYQWDISFGRRTNLFNDFGQHHTIQRRRIRLLP